MAADFRLHGPGAIQKAREERPAHAIEERREADGHARKQKQLRHEMETRRRLRARRIEIPFPQREVRILPGAAA